MSVQIAAYDAYKKSVAGFVAPSIDVKISKADNTNSFSKVIIKVEHQKRDFTFVSVTKSDVNDVHNFLFGQSLPRKRYMDGLPAAIASTDR